LGITRSPAGLGGRIVLMGFKNMMATAFGKRPAALALLQR